MKSTLLCFSIFAASVSFAGTSDSINTIKIVTAIDQLFDAMRYRYSSLAHAVFHPDARLMSTSQGKNGTQIHQDDIADFLKAIGTPQEEIWDERISNLVIQMDENLCQTWMDYVLFIDDLFITPLGKEDWGN
ncbi:MAG: hypothetical protein ACI865_001054 [Flavobacteriaceae bacterium]|jgi:hypothetical protein